MPSNSYNHSRQSYYQNQKFNNNNNNYSDERQPQFGVTGSQANVLQNNNQIGVKVRSNSKISTAAQQKKKKSSQINVVISTSNLQDNKKTLKST